MGLLARRRRGDGTLARSRPESGSRPTTPRLGESPFGVSKHGLGRGTKPSLLGRFGDPRVHALHRRSQGLRVVPPQVLAQGGRVHRAPGTTRTFCEAIGRQEYVVRDRDCGLHTRSITASVRLDRAHGAPAAREIRRRQQLVLRRQLEPSGSPGLVARSATRILRLLTSSLRSRATYPTEESPWPRCSRCSTPPRRPRSSRRTSPPTT